MVSVYSNRSTTGSFVGSCRNGAVYDLSNHFMGGYRDGKIYNSSGSLIGSYNDESIYSYDTSYERIGYFGESTVYDLGNQARGECISDKGAHAAALSFSPVATAEKMARLILLKKKRSTPISAAIQKHLRRAARRGNPHLNPAAFLGWSQQLFQV